MWKNIVKPDRPSTTIRRTRIACRVTKATNTHSEYAILYCSSTATMVARTRLNVTLYVQSVCLVNIKPVKQNTLLWKGEIPRHTTKIWDSGGKAPLIAGLGTGWTWVVSFIPRRYSHQWWGADPQAGRAHSGSERDSPLTQLELSYRAPQGLQCLEKLAER
jgi:hypothetical protein